MSQEEQWKRNNIPLGIKENWIICCTKNWIKEDSHKKNYSDDRHDNENCGKHSNI